MNVQTEFTTMHTLMFTSQLLSKLLSVYRREMEAEHFTIVEENYAEGKAALAHILNEEQSAILSNTAFCATPFPWHINRRFPSGMISSARNPTQNKISGDTPAFRVQNCIGAFSSAFCSLTGRLQQRPPFYCGSTNWSWNPSFLH